MQESKPKIGADLVCRIAYAKAHKAAYGMYWVPNQYYTTCLDALAPHAILGHEGKLTLIQFDSHR